MSYYTTSVTKVSDVTPVKLVDINAKTRPIKSMSLANIHATDDVAVDVYLKDAAGTHYYITEDVVIPNATTLVLDENLVNYNSNLYKLYIKLSAASSAVDVIIKNN